MFEHGLEKIFPVSQNWRLSFLIPFNAGWAGEGEPNLFASLAATATQASLSPPPLLPPSSLPRPSRKRRKGIENALSSH